jgi:hypothetical protein
VTFGIRERHRHSQNPPSSGGPARRDRLPSIHAAGLLQILLSESAVNLYGNSSYVAGAESAVYTPHNHGALLETCRKFWALRQQTVPCASPLASGAACAAAFLFQFGFASPSHAVIITRSGWSCRCDLASLACRCHPASLARPLIFDGTFGNVTRVVIPTRRLGDASRVSFLYV